MMLMTESKYLGNLEVTFGKVILTDPCYKFNAEKVVPARQLYKFHSQKFYNSW